MVEKKSMPIRSNSSNINIIVMNPSNTTRKMNVKFLSKSQILGDGSQSDLIWKEENRDENW